MAAFVHILRFVSEIPWRRKHEISKDVDMNGEPWACPVVWDRCKER